MKQLYQKLNIMRAIILCIIALLAIIPQQAKAQSGIQVIDQTGETYFRDQIVFTLNVKNPVEITEADLFYRIVGQLATSRNNAEFTPGAVIEAQFTIDQTEPANYFPPGTELEYWWKIVDVDGNELKTEREALIYLDERYTWQTLQNDRVTLYWYEGNEKFGQALFERANVALDTLETDIGLSLDDPIKIFIYADHRDLLGALSVTAQEWTGGVAFTQYGVVIIGIHPRQLDWGLNAMTHEMSHLVIHQATDNPFAGLPRWLDEGIAVYNENRDELDSDFKPYFERAVRDDKLMTLRTLTSPFSSDPKEANLSYGQSGSVVRFIVDTYGSDAMAQLLSVFAEGAIVDEALEQALGVDTDGLDNAFRANLGLPPLPGTEISQAEPDEATPESTNSSEEEEPVTVEVEATSESADVSTSTEAEPSSESSTSTETDEEPETASQPSDEVSPDDSSVSTEDESPQNPPSFLPCLGGILFLLVMGRGVFKG